MYNLIQSWELTNFYFTAGFVSKIYFIQLNWKWVQLIPETNFDSKLAGKTLRPKPIKKKSNQIIIIPLFYLTW